MILFIFLFSITFCNEIKELKKYSSIKVAPETLVYMDISSFKTGENIYFEIIMDLFFADHNQQKEEYTFNIDQVSYITHDENNWNSLTSVTTRDKEERTETIFKWKETKKEGMTYIYIKTPTPYNDYSHWENTIEIKNTLKNNATTLAIILCTVIAGIIIIVIIIVCCCCCCKKKKTYINPIRPVRPTPIIQLQPQMIYPPQNVAYRNIPQQSYSQPGQFSGPQININLNPPNYQSIPPYTPKVPDTTYNSHQINNMPGYQHPLDAQISSKTGWAPPY